MNWWEGKDKWFDCFLVLGVSENASTSEIKKAYRDLMKKLHPDVNPKYDADEIARIELAYNTLSDEKMRKRYTEFTHRCKRKQEESKTNEKSGSQEKDGRTDFEKAVDEYKKSEKNLKVMINVSIKNVENREKGFSSVYESFCNDIKNGSMNSKTFEIRKQKLRTVMFAGISIVDETRKIITEQLSNINFEEELKILNNIEESFKSKDDILTSSYTNAKKKLSGIKVESSRISKFKKCPVKFELAFLSLLLVAGIYFISPFGRFFEDKEVLEETVEEEVEEILEAEEVTEENDNNIYTSSDCILFESVPEDIVYDTMTDPFEYAGREVIRARKDGIQYLLDASDMHVLISNYLSSGPVLIDRDTYDCVLVFLGIDGRDYTVDISDFRTVLNVREAYSSESEVFYLDGYGEVIETESHGGKHLIDAKTRESLVDLYDEYSELYYDEELDSDVYCFSNEYTDTYVQANDLKKVLKVEHN